MGGNVLHLVREVSNLVAQTFISGLWQGLALASMVALCLRLLPSIGASVRFAVWAFTFALVVALPLMRVPTVAMLHPGFPVEAVHLGPIWGFCIAALWGVAMFARAFQLLVQSVRLHRIWRRAKPFAALDEDLQMLRGAMRRAELCASCDVDSPSVIGFFWPRLLIPERLAETLTTQELRQIVLHECEHLRRGDDWMNLLQKIGIVLFPLNPALLWVDRRLGLERELACDAGVASATAAPFDYARCLTRLAEHRMGGRSVALALSAWSRQSELAQRVHSLLRPMRAISPLRARASVAVLGVGLIGAAVVMGRVPGFVSFTDVAVEQASANPLNPIGTQALPVAFRSGSQPQATLVKASLTVPVKVHCPVVKVKPRVARALRAELGPLPMATVSQQARLVLTSERESTTKWNERRADRDVSHSVRVIPADFSYTYAAVPFGDGWLIIQL